MEPIETASDLCREIKNRGLHLRSENGRDDALLDELIGRLNCPDDQLQAFLDGSSLKAEDFLLAFLELAQPFAKMFEEIWEFLGTYCAPKAEETIAIRFGFPDAAKKCTVDFDRFRRYVDTQRRILTALDTHIWPFEALSRLFDLGRMLLPPAGDDIYRRDIYRPYDMHGRYSPGRPYRLPTIDVGSHPFDEIVKEVRAVFQQIIDGYAAERRRQEKPRALPEIQREDEAAQPSGSLRNSASLLTDLLPTWFYILTRYSDVDDSVKDDALRQYNQSIRELLRQGSHVARIPVREALDILDMPFWRHRWHTYEIWATVLTLRALADYKPRPRVENGQVPLDGYSAAVVADLAARDCPSACVAIQVETPFALAQRTAIKPDLRICFDASMADDQTAGVVEYKQRRRIDPRNLAEVATAYSSGCPRGGGVLILNYDVTETLVQLPSGCYFLEGVQPLGHDAIEDFEKRLGEMLIRADLQPARGDTIVLLDVSSSMGDTYKDESVQAALRVVLATPWVKILRFSDGLQPGGDLDARSARGIRTSGGTELGRALEQIEAAFGVPERLMIVTDGGHDHPTQLLARIPRVKECTPSEMAANISWLTS